MHALLQKANKDTPSFLSQLQHQAGEMLGNLVVVMIRLWTAGIVFEVGFHSIAGKPKL